MSAAPAHPGFQLAATGTSEGAGPGIAGQSTAAPAAGLLRLGVR
jgi:hypothetical protein